ncbi:MAG: hypothetical protein QOH96_1698 [Blastocatellia bacterium]|jgi:hypothetical protein|nr:hypothetical protein [Blastocatellia bacterium]
MLVLIINLIYKNRLNLEKSRAVNHILDSEKLNTHGLLSDRHTLPKAIIQSSKVKSIEKFQSL